MARPAPSPIATNNVVNIESLLEDLHRELPFYQQYFQRKSVRNWIPQPWVSNAARQEFALDRQHDKAQSTLSHMGTNAWPAVPVLVRDVADPNHFFGGALRAAEILTAIRAEDHPDWPRLVKAWNGKLDGVPEQVLPTLSALLKHKLVVVRTGALKTIADMGPSARQLQPEVIPLATDANVSVRQAAAEALRRIGSDSGFPGPANFSVPPSSHQSLAFGLFWPPQPPDRLPPPDRRPLLKGRLDLRCDGPAQTNVVIHLRIVLTRLSDEAGRAFWNSQLAFPEYDWMRLVRVWDADERWLWPNLPYLLRLHGSERVERYGGVDPGKGVDNDFAAVLIRKYDTSGQNESPDSRRSPLVAADWSPVERGTVDQQTIVHAAQSDEFTLHLGAAENGADGLAVVWLIYADFMGAKVPECWPKEPEFTGGILACFEVSWNLKALPKPGLKVHHVVPKQATGFDWERWARRTRAVQDSQSTARLSDRPN